MFYRYLMIEILVSSANRFHPYYVSKRFYFLRNNSTIL